MATTRKSDPDLDPEQEEEFVNKPVEGVDEKELPTDDLDKPEADPEGDELPEDEEPPARKSSPDGSEDTLTDLADERLPENQSDESPKKTFEPRLNPSVKESLKTYGNEESEEEIRTSEHTEYSNIPNLRSSDKGDRGAGYEQEEWAQRPPRSGYSGNFGSSFNRPKKSGNKMHVLILLVLGIAVIGATVYFLKGGKASSLVNKLQPSPTPAPTTASTPTPSPSAEPLDRAKFNLRVLNGTAKSGYAGQIATKLKDLGYVVDKTGNATNSAFEKTVIKVKSGDSSLSAQLVKDLSLDYDPTDSSLKDSDTVKAEIILGTK